jgi:uracil-DNA glycosylase
VEPLADRVAACERCGLARTRRRAIAGECPPGATVLLIAAAPSFPAELVGRALSDEARDVLAAAGVDVSAVAATTLVKCRPPAGRAPTADEIEACRPYLEEQVADQRPETVIALGAAVLRALAPAAPPLEACHGHSRPVTIGGHDTRLLPVLDPYAIAEVPSLAALLAADLGGPPAPAASPAPATAPPVTAPPDETEPDGAPQLGLF